MSGPHVEQRIGHEVDFFVVDWDGYELLCTCGEKFESESRWRTLAEYGVHHDLHLEALRDGHPRLPNNYDAHDNPASWPVTTAAVEPCPEEVP